MPIFYLLLSFFAFFLSNIHPSFKIFKRLTEPLNIFDNSDKKKLFISWNTEYKQLTFLTNHTSSNIDPGKALLTTYSIYDQRLNNYCNKTSTYLIPWQFKTYKNKDRSEDIIIQEGDVSTNLSECKIHIERYEDIDQSKVLQIHNTNTELNNELNLNEDYTDNNCRYFFTPNYFFLSYECKDYYLTNPLAVGAFELDKTVLNDMKNYFTKEEEEEKKNIDYRIFVYEWDPQKNFEFTIDDNEFTITYNGDNTITIANKNSMNRLENKMESGLTGGDKIKNVNTSLSNQKRKINHQRLFSVLKIVFFSLFTLFLIMAIKQRFFKHNVL